jgi:hypothetical protein
VVEGTGVIRRIVHVVVMVVLAGAAFAFRSGPVESDPGLMLERAPTTFFGCAASVDQALTGSAVIGSIVRGPVTARLASTGSTAVSTEIDPAGGAAADLAGLGAAGAVGILVEGTSSDAGVSVIETGTAGSLASTCTAPITESAIAVGGSTGGTERLELIVTNPYAVDAVVAVTSSSEVGDDSARELASVLVPARTTVVEDLADLLPLRQVLSVRLTVERGAVHAALFQTVDGDVAMVEAVPPAQDWWLPLEVPADTDTRVVVSTDSLLPVEIRIDAYAAGAVTQSVVETELAARGQLVFAATDLAAMPGGVRVSADGPIVVGLVQNGAGRRAASPGVATLNSEWLATGAGSFDASRALVLNPGEVEAELVLQPLAPDTPARAVSIPINSVAAVTLGRGGAGYLIRSTSEVAVLWSADGTAGSALGAAVPVAILTE